ncbi:membrane-associated Zn-dependent protease 1 [Enterobacter hormaechei]
MKKLLLVILLAGLVLSLFILAPGARAGAVPVLSFHMGLGAEGKFFVGGTLRNDGDQPVTQGYLVILPVTERCEPERFVFYEFGELPAGSTREFRIPVSGRLVSYRLAGAGAVDDMGFALPVRDDTKAVLDARREEETRACKARRSTAHAQP